MTVIILIQNIETGHDDVIVLLYYTFMKQLKENCVKLSPTANHLFEFKPSNDQTAASSNNTSKTKYKKIGMHIYVYIGDVPSHANLVCNLNRFIIVGKEIQSSNTKTAEYHF